MPLGGLPFKKLPVKQRIERTEQGQNTYMYIQTDLAIQSSPNKCIVAKGKIDVMTRN